ncbi:hypothetical protein CYY_009109 [Polysphondylium violaceum]|uniref:Cullin N-terminal domain-containing protein n=1 Tax=Polysphondylium violaceum TaxID=133409 RepID=A0A8J4UWH6_9MYCE|nr:hypothetical protein CYY_009109 [Polysphondylium violaceum]
MKQQLRPFFQRFRFHLDKFPDEETTNNWRLLKARMILSLTTTTTLQTPTTTTTQNNDDYLQEEMFKYVLLLNDLRYYHILYKKLEKLFNNHINSYILPFLLNNNDDDNDAHFLTKLNSSWQSYKVSMHLFKRILYNIELFTQASQKPITDLGLSLFNDLVLRSPPIKEKIFNSLVLLSMKIQQGDTIDLYSIKSIGEQMILNAVKKNQTIFYMNTTQ